MKVKYKILAVFNGVSNEFNYPVEKKTEAISDYKNIKMRADRCKLFSIDSEDDELWYDLSNKY